MSSLPVPSEEALEHLPDAQDVQEGIEMVEAEEAAREQELQSPEAVSQREQSRYAFADVSAVEAQELLQSAFAEQLAALNSDPARFLSDAEIIRPLGASVAAVSEDGDTSLLDAGIPVRATDEDGDLSKVDLSLGVAPENFAPANPLVEISIPDEAGEAIEVGDDGLAVSALGAEEDRQALQFGDKNIFYPNALGAEADTDQIVSPTAAGVEIFDLLRSADSPEVLRFAVSLPEGSQLRADGSGGAVVLQGEEAIASIPFPSAVDAQGTEVPVELQVEGDTIALHVAHREADLAYPILVDPILEDWVNVGTSWYNGHNLQALENGAWGAWSPTGQIYNSTSCIYTCWGSGRGLFISAPSRNYGAEVFAHWGYSAPNLGSYVSKAWLIPFWRDDHGCSQGQYSQPHDYDGFWGDNQWNLLQANQAINAGSVAVESWGRAFIVGLSSGGGVNLPCWRDLFVGGAAIWLDDWGNPAINSVTGIPGGWVSDTTQFTITANASDGGLGVHRVTVFPEGKAVLTDNVGGCTGLAGNRCPATRASQFTQSGDSFGEGVRFVQVSAEAPNGKTSGTYQTYTRVDRTPPEVTLNGQLAQATNEVGSQEVPAGTGDKLRLPVYNLKVEAKDGSNANDASKRSGVKDIEVFLDGKEVEVPWAPQSCPNNSCSMTKTYTLKLNNLASAGKHTLVVKAVDQVGKVRERNVEFEYFPATGLKDEYVMHYFPLPDGQGNEAEEEHPKRPELAVNVMNGNLVYRERDIEVPGPATNLEVERYYNSLLPQAENSEWGDGWTLAQTPELTPPEDYSTPGQGSGGSQEGGSGGQGGTGPTGTFVGSSGFIQGSVELPASTGQTRFDPSFQALISKEPGGGYEVADQSGKTDTALAFDQDGRIAELRTGGYAKVDYDYEGGALAEIAVNDPASAGGGPAKEAKAPAPDSTPIYASTFGSSGSGDGQFSAPGDVAVAPGGNIWVVDKGNNRIEKFNSKGEFLLKFGSSGAGNGQLSTPTSLAIDAQGNIWVTERGNNRVQKFGPNGEYLAKFGSFGAGNGQLSGPEGVAIDPQGNVWVSDTHSGRVQKFNAAGELLKVVASKGSGTGQLGEPTGIDIGPGGKVWVADWQNNRISVFSEAGEFLFQFGLAGAGPGQFNHPDAIDVDAKGNVWVGDQNNGRVQLFGQEGKYFDQFGSKGSGQGQFNFAYPMGIATDDKGAIWVTDPNNNRVQKWAIPQPPPNYTDVIYADSFGVNGSGNGQLKAPADAAVDASGNLWVLDKGNNRVQKFNSKGEYLSKFGTYGSGNGQLNGASGIASDPEGNLWISDTGNNRVQKFNSKGEYLSKFGTYGSGNGQLKGPAGIAVAPDGGSIYVIDRGNHRLELFGKDGVYWGQKGSYGWEDAQFNEPTGVAIGGPSGEKAFTVLVTDSGNNRIQRFGPLGNFLGKFGSYGSGNGQLKKPSAIDVDSNGGVWVGDRENGRVQVFDQEGKYIDHFGSAGTGEGQFGFAYPMGIATDGNGGIWVTDPNNNRMQKWVAGRYFLDEDEELAPDDPAVEVEVSSGLVSGVEGEEAGEHTYTHSGQLLTAHEGPQGKSTYEYDSAGRMTKVVLPNGTSGSIAYFASDGRVKSVTVDPAGSPPAKTTTFEYSDEPRRTIVVPPDTPHVTYDIGADGSVLKWWNAQQPPIFDDMAGTLYDNREKTTPISVGDHTLDTQAYSPEGIASINVIANGNQLVDEETCEQDPVKPGIECTTLINEWVTSTELHAPGYLYLEVVITDRLGQSASERFWVNIPQPPPPPAPGTPIPPKFRDIATFREEYGLEVVFPVKNEIELNERIFNLIGAWHNPSTPAGEVARASMERWGVPLRPEDIAELEYRERYIAANGPLIFQWGESQAPTTYAGYYIDHRAGGKIRIGFTTDQSAKVSNLQQLPGVMATDRLTPFSVQPAWSLAQLRNKSGAFAKAIQAQPSIMSIATTSRVDVKANKVSVGATNTSAMSNFLTEQFGATTAIGVVFDPHKPEFRSEEEQRERELNNRLYAGDLVQPGCTLAFGAWEERPDQNHDGHPDFANFALGAGHCYFKNIKVERIGFRREGGQII